MSSIKIIGDGTGIGTKVYGPDGNEFPFVQEVKLRIGIDTLVPEVWIRVADVELDLCVDEEPVTVIKTTPDAPHPTGKVTHAVFNRIDSAEQAKKDDIFKGIFDMLDEISAGNLTQDQIDELNRDAKVFLENWKKST